MIGAVIVAGIMALAVGFAWGAWWAARYIETRQLPHEPDDVQ